MERPCRANETLLQHHPAMGVVLEDGRFTGCVYAWADVLGNVRDVEGVENVADMRDASPLDPSAGPLSVGGRC
jgi:hypothetical protein